MFADAESVASATVSSERRSLRHNPAQHQLGCCEKRNCSLFHFVICVYK